MRPIIAAAKLLLFCHLGKFFALFFHKTAEIVAFTPFSATISSPFQPIDTPSAAPVSEGTEKVPFFYDPQIRNYAPNMIQKRK